MAKPLLKRLVEESKKTLASYQTVINLPGLAYKGLIPATFGTETAARFQVWSGIYLKQTAPSHLLRNPKNKPDEYELTILERLANSDRPQQNDTTVSETLEREKTVRVILPLYYGKACLSCHGEPKGERDITGYPREGGREGELGGAISVKLPLQ
jgi:general secretion pathway protein A